MTTIRHEFFERATAYAYPVVAHEFTGKTLDEAKGYFRAHLRYDRMLRAVSGVRSPNNRVTGVWNGIQYYSVVRIVR